MKKNIELFYYNGCPFCMRVLSFLKSENLKIELRNIQEDPKSLERLVNDTGRRTVPCLYIDNVPMFESADIISWLSQNKNLIG